MLWGVFWCPEEDVMLLRLLFLHKYLVIDKSEEAVPKAVLFCSLYVMYAEPK